MNKRIPERQHAVNTSQVLPLRTPAGDAVSVLAFQILRLSAEVTLAGDRISKPAGQTSARWQVLAAADHAPSTVADIARMLGLARQSVQRVADLLASEGLVSYEDNPEHQRAKLVHLTETGVAALREIQRAQVEWANALGAQLNATELARASQTLQSVLQLLQR